MAKKKKRSKESVASTKGGEASASAAALEKQCGSPPGRDGGDKAPRTAPEAAPSTHSKDAAETDAPAADKPNKFDAAAHDRFASSFQPSWQVAAAGGSAGASDLARQEHALSGEISLDAIPLPPLPTDKPRRQMIGVAVLLLLIIGVGVAISMRSSSEAADPAPPATGDGPH